MDERDEGSEIERELDFFFFFLTFIHLLYIPGIFILASFLSYDDNVLKWKKSSQMFSEADKRFSKGCLNHDFKCDRFSDVLSKNENDVPGSINCYEI